MKLEEDILFVSSCSSLISSIHAEYCHTWMIRHIMKICITSYDDDLFIDFDDRPTFITSHGLAVVGEELPAEMV